MAAARQLRTKETGLGPAPHTLISGVSAGSCWLSRLLQQLIEADQALKYCPCGMTSALYSRQVTFAAFGQQDPWLDSNLVLHVSLVCEPQA